MRYTFGAYTLDVQRDKLRAAEGVVQLDRQVFAVLAYLVQHHDRVVRRQELFEQLWPERFVSDAALERCIVVARRAVGDSGRTQHTIQTVHGQGYRFVAAVEERQVEVSAVAGTGGPCHVRPCEAPSRIVPRRCFHLRLPSQSSHLPRRRSRSRPAARGLLSLARQRPSGAN